MAHPDARQTEQVPAKTELPRYIRDRLDAKAKSEGMTRATYLRRLVYRDVREDEGSVA